MAMPASSMVMTFFESTSTSIFSMAWTPSGASQYAGTCIFLIALATAFRGLIAIRSNMSWLLACAFQPDSSSLSTGGPYSGIDEEAKLDHHQASKPSTITEALTRAVLDTVLGGVSYLLQVSSTRNSGEAKG